jgi:hypothetical protein
MMYIQNTHFRGFKLTFADWFRFSLIEELTYEIDETVCTTSITFYRTSIFTYEIKRIVLKQGAIGFHAVLVLLLFCYCKSIIFILLLSSNHFVIYVKINKHFEPLIKKRSNSK